ncbi:hypothetical protein [Oceanobacillus kimchii]|uniref:hypothetical protein n=1 Tax=Oceanobacillus kimchii TaxID=746691 RepID=UPI003B0121E7
MDDKLARELIRELRGIRKALEGEQSVQVDSEQIAETVVENVAKAGERVRI